MCRPGLRRVSVLFPYVRALQTFNVLGFAGQRARYPRLCGVCGSDTKQVYLNGSYDNPMTAYISFPQVLGHEVVATVERVGPAVTTTHRPARESDPRCRIAAASSAGSSMRPGPVSPQA